MTNSLVPVQPGDLISGKFRVEQVLGTGGVGIVVAARHLQLGERVALKFLLPDATRSEVDVARFCREAQAVVRLKSEHVARVIDVGALDSGSPYIVMEYLIGTDLAELLEGGGPITPEDAVDYVLQACEAIAEAHSIGLIHRDLKPSNLFLTERADGSPLIKVLDFGIAKYTAEATLAQGDPALTHTNALLGSPMYMSPEQVRNSRAVDVRSDIWSLGIVLYELVTGRVPFEAKNVAAVIAAVVGDPLPSVRVLCPAIPDGLAEAIECCLAKKPGDRFQNVAELAQAIAPFGPAHGHISASRIAGTLGALGTKRKPKHPRSSLEATVLTAESGGPPAFKPFAARAPSPGSTTIRSASVPELRQPQRKGPLFGLGVAGLVLSAVGVVVTLGASVGERPATALSGYGPAVSEASTTASGAELLPLVERELEPHGLVLSPPFLDDTVGGPASVSVASAAPAVSSGRPALPAPPSASSLRSRRGAAPSKSDSVIDGTVDTRR